jgi:hypothetical protein
MSHPTLVTSLCFTVLLSCAFRSAFNYRFKMRKVVFSSTDPSWITTQCPRKNLRSLLSAQPNKDLTLWIYLYFLTLDEYFMLIGDLRQVQTFPTQ